MQPVPSTPTLWSDCEPRCELHELHEETLLSGLAAACGVPASAIALSHLDRGQARRTEESGLLRSLPAGAPAAAVGPSGTATAAPSEPPPRPPPPPPPPPEGFTGMFVAGEPLPPPPPPEGYTGIFVAGDAAPTAGADAVGEFREVDLRGAAFRDLRGPFEVGEISEIARLALETSSSLHLSASIALPSRSAAEATVGGLDLTLAHPNPDPDPSPNPHPHPDPNPNPNQAGWLESAAPETIAEAVGLLHAPSPPATNPAHAPAPALSPSPSPHANPHPSSTRWAIR